jgi:hypothetical protein
VRSVVGELVHADMRRAQSDVRLRARPKATFLNAKLDLKDGKEILKRNAAPDTPPVIPAMGSVFCYRPCRSPLYGLEPMILEEANEFIVKIRPRPVYARITDALLSALFAN